MPKARASSIGRDVQAIRRSLVAIVGALARSVPALEAATRGAGKPGRRGRKLKLSPARRASLKLQGQYMGHLRNLKPRQKARVKAFRATKGIPRAIALAKALSRQVHRTPRA